ncbi:MAG: lysophospholipid acyltransferase family protein [Thermodesulfobacteriota bacterium]|nr:lysophospholipid acyltransferase family protein [Thermodesulfobacteriota bacterium]
MIRFFYLNAFIALFTIICSAWGLLLSAFDRSGRVIHYYVAAPWARMILRVCGVKVAVTGWQNVDSRRPHIYMANHQSYFDILALLAYLPVDFKFILKQELMKIPLFGLAMKRAGYIAINREDPRKAVRGINEASKRIKNGTSVLIFPEGTRSVDGRLQSFKRGGFYLALKSGCDLLPVTIINSHNIVPKGSLRVNRGVITMAIGKPISVKTYTKKDTDQLMNRVREAIINQT